MRSTTSDSSSSELTSIGTTPLPIKLTYKEMASIELLHTKSTNSRLSKNESENKSEEN